MDNILKEFELACPSCGNPNLHHEKVAVFDRAEEDSLNGLHVSIHRRKVCVDESMNSNPSSRRNGMIVYFNCEHCEKITSLTISQHKGTTYLNQQIGRTRSRFPEEGL